MSTTPSLSQLSSFSSISQTRKIHLTKPSSLLFTRPPIKFSIRTSIEGNDTQTSSISEIEDTLRTKLHVVDGEQEANPISQEQSHEGDIVPEQSKKTAKIHDFCLGIPFGGLVLTGGVFGSIFSRNLSTLGTGVLLGGGLLALSTFSLKVWRERKSSLPFILGQAALAVALLWNNLQRYFLTQKFFPAGVYVAISAAMLCFYSYVVAAGGNPPPKNKKLIAKSAS